MAQEFLLEFKGFLQLLKKSQDRLMPFRLLFPCVPWSRGTNNITLKKWAHFRPAKGGSVFTNQIAKIQFLTNQGPLFRMLLLLLLKNG